MKPEEFLKLLWEEHATAILRAPDQKVGARAMEAAIRGGFRIVEFTLTIPGAMELIAEFSKRSELVVGVGTVLRKEEAQQAVKNGAKFLVSPVVDEEIIREGLALGVAVIPGAYTPTEMLRAYRAGAQLQKLFPAPAGGPSFVRACLAPMPFLRIVPTNGVDEHNAADYLRAGSYAVGFVGTLFAVEDLRDQRYDRIEERARILRKAVSAIEK